jgi:ASC-1-like (ASCH) protein
MKWVLKFGAYKDKDDVFEAVAAGEKTIETRPLNPEKKKNYGQIKPGDELVLVSLSSGRKMNKTVKSVRKYKSVEEMAEKEQTEKIFPGVKTAAELVKIFAELKKKWGKEYARKLEKYGIAAIEME